MEKRELGLLNYFVRVIYNPTNRKYEHAKQLNTLFIPVHKFYKLYDYNNNMPLLVNFVSHSHVTSRYMAFIKKCSLGIFH